VRHVHQPVTISEVADQRAQFHHALLAERRSAAA
jgi:hypothetical protein